MRSRSHEKKCTATIVSFQIIYNIIIILNANYVYILVDNMQQNELRGP